MPDRDEDRWVPTAFSWKGTLYMTLRNEATGAWIIPRQVVMEAGQASLEAMAADGGMVEDERGH
jgi:hypothetical protein